MTTQPRHIDAEGESYGARESTLRKILRVHRERNRDVRREIEFSDRDATIAPVTRQKDAAQYRSSEGAAYGTR